MKPWNQVAELIALVQESDVLDEAAKREYWDIPELDPADYPTTEAYRAAYKANWETLRIASDKSFDARAEVQRAFFWGFVRYYDPGRRLSEAQLTLLWRRMNGSTYEIKADGFCKDLKFACEFAGLELV